MNVPKITGLPDQNERDCRRSCSFWTVLRKASHVRVEVDQAYRVRRDALPHDIQAVIEKESPPCLRGATRHKVSLRDDFRNEGSGGVSGLRSALASASGVAVRSGLGGAAIARWGSFRVPFISGLGGGSRGICWDIMGLNTPE